MKALTDEQREQFLETELREAERLGGRPTFPVEVRGNIKHLSVFRIGIAVPKFRLENGRTIRGLQEYIFENPDSAEALKDKSSAEAQEIIQTVLLSMVEKEDLINILAEEGQRDPLILSKQGYVLNGNRRLAAMRKLSQDTRHSRRFQDIDVVLLPQLDESELSAIEMRLQMAIEGKARYNWLDELLVIQKNIKELNMDIEKVRVAMRTTKPTLQLKLLMYELVAEYLKFANRAGQFFSVVSDEQAFKTLAQGLKRYEKRLDLQAELKARAFEIILRKPKNKSIHLQIKDLLNVLPDLAADRVAAKEGARDVPLNPANPFAGLSSAAAPRSSSPVSEQEFSQQIIDLQKHQKTHEVREARKRQLRMAEDALSIVNAMDAELGKHNKEQLLATLSKLEQSIRSIKEKLTS